MKKNVCLILLSVLFVWMTVAEDLEWLEEPQRFGEEHLGSGYQYHYGMSPEMCISKTVARRLAEEDLIDHYKRLMVYSLERFAVDDFDFTLGDDGFFYVWEMRKFAQDSNFYNFEFFDDYYEVYNLGCFGAVFGRVSLEDTFSLLQKAAELKYEYAYGKPVPEYTKETVRKTVEALY